MVMEFIEGQPLVASLDSERARQLLAQTLVAIHAADLDTTHLRRYDTPEEHLNVVGASPPDSDLVDAGRLRNALEAAIPDGHIEPVLAHGDFHGGNVLWDGSTVTAVLDWPMAVIADRWWDEAYAHMDTWLAHGSDAAAELRREYRDLSGDAPTADAERFWDLIAVARVLPGPGQWLTAYLHSGVHQLTTETINQRYVDMIDRLL
jgi:aminoglycoside phosphotransferase (APT) family kinase protein